MPNKKSFDETEKNQLRLQTTDSKYYYIDRRCEDSCAVLKLSQTSEGNPGVTQVRKCSSIESVLIIFTKHNLLSEIIQFIMNHRIPNQLISLLDNPINNIVGGRQQPCGENSVKIGLFDAQAL